MNNEPVINAQAKENQGRNDDTDQCHAPHAECVSQSSGNGLGQDSQERGGTNQGNFRSGPIERLDEMRREYVADVIDERVSRRLSERRGEQEPPVRANFSEICHLTSHNGPAIRPARLRLAPARAGDELARTPQLT